MQTETAKMIYPSKDVADLIAAKLCESKGKHIVMKVTTGFQVCPVTICQGAVSPNNAAPYPKPKPAPVIDLQPVIDGDKVTLTMPFLKETEKFLGVKNNKDAVLYIGKGSILAYEVVGEAYIDGEHVPAKAIVTVKTKWAQGKGLI